MELQKFFRLDTSLPMGLLLICAVLTANGLHIEPILFAKVFILFMTAMLFSFGVNNYFDVELDRGVRDKNPISTNEMSVKSAQIAISIIFFLLIVELWFWFRQYMLILLVVFILPILYDVPHIRLKTKPIIDLLWHGFILWGMPFSAVYFLMGGVLNPFFIIICSLVILLSIFVELSQQLRDFKSDKKAGIKTTTIFFGRKKSVEIMIFLLSLSILVIVLGVILGVLKFMDILSIILPVLAIRTIESNRFSIKSVGLMNLLFGYLILRRILFP